MRHAVFGWRSIQTMLCQSAGGIGPDHVWLKHAAFAEPWIGEFGDVQTGGHGAAGNHSKPRVSGDCSGVWHRSQHRSGGLPGFDGIATAARCTGPAKARGAVPSQGDAGRNRQLGAGSPVVAAQGNMDLKRGILSPGKLDRAGSAGAVRFNPRPQEKAEIS